MALLRMLAAAATLSVCLAADPALVIDTPMDPPRWALLERELLRSSSLACERFAARYLDERGYLLHTIRWGTLDGPDDAIETFYNWTLLHALAAPMPSWRSIARPRRATGNNTTSCAPG